MSAARRTVRRRRATGTILIASAALTASGALPPAIALAAPRATAGTEITSLEAEWLADTTHLDWLGRPYHTDEVGFIGHRTVSPGDRVERTLSVRNPSRDAATSTVAVLPLAESQLEPDLAASVFLTWEVGANAGSLPFTSLREAASRSPEGAVTLANAPVPAGEELAVRVGLQVDRGLDRRREQSAIDLAAYAFDVKVLLAQSGEPTEPPPPSPSPPPGEAETPGTETPGPGASPPSLDSASEPSGIETTVNRLPATGSQLAAAVAAVLSLLGFLLLAVNGRARGLRQQPSRRRRTRRRSRHRRRTLVTVCAVAATLAIPSGLPAAGHQALTVLSGSMSPAINPGDVVLVRRVPTDRICAKVNVGQVVTFRPDSAASAPVTHRVAAKTIGRTDAAAHCRLETRGDANSGTDSPVAPEQVLGVVAARIPRVGLARDGVAGFTTLVDRFAAAARAAVASFEAGETR